MAKSFKYGILFLLILGLIAVRAFIEPLFYDPLIEYFKTDYLSKSVPKIDMFLYFLNISIRYIVNSIISITIIYLVFEKKEIAVFSAKIFFVAFLVLMMLLFLALYNYLGSGYLFLFYVRRFLIHPIILLVLIPAFYYQKLNFKNQ
ncbi:exosortase F system-associated protein [Lutibacter sp.]|uniref:exosortase F system-associated membrane protein n=1 Tax=Lutibacter sp. TaxID=1925666 RepID=UPI003569C4F4